MLSLAELRHRHSRFYFDEVVIESETQQLVVRLRYHFENGESFETVLTFPELSTEMLAHKDMDLIKMWAAQLGMVEGLSYWKAACSPEWVVEVPGVYPEQTPFFLNLIHKGMSEFFFIHEINGWEDNFIKFVYEVSDNNQLHPTIDATKHQDRILLPVGGGKDSVVTSELLRQTNTPITTLTINSYPQQQAVIDTFWKEQSEKCSHITITRKLDRKIMVLNAQGYLNGHTPFNAMAAFVGSLACYLYDYTYFPVSNEWSANEGNTVFLGQSINHQYSKSVEFEQLFREFQQKYFSTTIEYFSFLRPLHELQIAELFVNYPQYWPVFLSCNRGQRTGEWCGECPKCLFVAVMLSAFLDNTQLDEIFRKDILNNMSLRDIFDQLAGFTEVKSLECVGTLDETRAAVAMAVEHLKPVPELIAYGWQRLLKEGTSEDTLKSSAKELRQQYMADHFIPSQFERVLKEALNIT